MKTNEELNALRSEVETLNKKLAELTEDELKQVAGGEGLSEEDAMRIGDGMSNPVAGMSEEDAMRIAKEMNEGTYSGSWRSMSGAQFLEWWRASNGR